MKICTASSTAAWKSFFLTTRKGLPHLERSPYYTSWLRLKNLLFCQSVRTIPSVIKDSVVRLFGSILFWEKHHKVSLTTRPQCFKVGLFNIGNFLFEMGYTMFKNTSRRLSFAGINVNLTVEYYWSRSALSLLLMNSIISQDVIILWRNIRSRHQVTFSLKLYPALTK